MNYLLKAMQTLGIYYTPSEVLNHGYGEGKTIGSNHIMGNPPFMRSPEYRRLLRRQCDLLERGTTTGISYAEGRELRDIEDRMTLIELAHKRGPIEAVTDDYTFAVGQAGDLGGVELL